MQGKQSLDYPGHIKTCEFDDGCVHHKAYVHDAGCAHNGSEAWCDLACYAWCWPYLKSSSTMKPRSPTTAGKLL